jgi:D-alanine-D-alanine ligase
MPPDYKVLILYRPMPDLDADSELQQTIATHETIVAVDEALRAAAFDTHIIHVGDDIEQVLGTYDPRETVIFNYCDGYHDNPSGYDPITQLYEQMGFAYTGADDQTLCQSQDKAITKSQLVQQGIPTPEYRFFDSDDVSAWTVFPAFVKPAHLHASMGILPESVVENRQQLRQQVQRILDEFQHPALVEDFIEGDEYRVSIWGNHKLEVLPVTGFYYMPDQRYGLKHFDAKWDETGYHSEVPASRLTPILQARIEAAAKATFQAVNMRDYGGIDMRVRGDQPYVIDPNQNADISPESTFLRAVKAVGGDYSDMMGQIVRLASARRPM